MSKAGEAGKTGVIPYGVVLNWFADDSEVIGIRKTQIYDILMFGGITVPVNMEHGPRSWIDKMKRNILKNHLL